MKRLLLVTSTFPATDTDPVPGFVKEQVIWLKKNHPELTIDVLAPHNSYSKTTALSRHKHYTEHRFHYFFPFRWELLTGRGIQPALKQNKFLYVQLPFLFICQFFAILKYTKKLKPDVLYAHWFTPQAITCAIVSRITGVPLAFNTHASDVIVLKRVPCSKKIVAAVCRQAYMYTASSLQTANKLRYFATQKNKDILEKKLHIIPMGAAYVQPKSQVISRLKKHYGLDGKTVILFFGRIVDRKGIDLLIAAFQECGENNKDTVLIIAGEGQEKPELMRLAAKTAHPESIIWPGFISGDAKAAFIALSDIVCVPSVNIGDNAEGLPIVFMEALVYKKVTVISDVTGAHETVDHGHNSFVFKAGDVSDLTTKLNKAIVVAKSKDRRFYASIAKLSKDFEWASIAERHYNLLAQKK